MNQPLTPTGQRLFTTNKDRMPRNLTVKESEIFDIENELLDALDAAGYAVIHRTQLIIELGNHEPREDFTECDCEDWSPAKCSFNDHLAEQILRRSRGEVG